MKITGLCYYANVVNEEGKNINIDHQKTFTKTHIVPQTKHQLQHIINTDFSFGDTRSWMKISYKLGKRTTKTIEKNYTNIKQRKKNTDDNEWYHKL